MTASARDALIDRIMRRVSKHPNGCWIWAGCTTKGYGQVRARELGGTKLVHRVVYERLVGPIPEGLELDHLCRAPTCCNPAHLEPVTHAENMRRGQGLLNMIATRRGLTHCKNGHEFTPENTYVNPGTNTRRCRECHRQWTRRYLARRRST